MLFSIMFAFWRFLEIVTLIPTLGMLAWLVNIYNTQNLLTPQPPLVLFIVSVLACIWVIATLFTYHRSKANSLFVAFIDTVTLGALIAAAYLLRGIGNDNCSAPGSDTLSYSYTISLGFPGVAPTMSLDRPCAIVKASWVFAILNCIFFTITALLAFSVRNAHPPKETYVRETHYERHGHRRSGSNHSRRSRRSSHSARPGVYGVGRE